MAKAATMQDQVIVIGTWDDAASRSLRLQNFEADGGPFIPIFSDEAAFKRQVKGSGFESAGIAINRRLLFAILRGDEVLVLNPGDPKPVRLTKADLAEGANAHKAIFGAS
jgi:hypothetical protein